MLPVALSGLWCAAQSPGMDDEVDRPEPPSAKAVTALLREARSLSRRADKLSGTAAAVGDPTTQQLAAEAVPGDVPVGDERPRKALRGAAEQLVPGKIHPGRGLQSRQDRQLAAQLAADACTSMEQLVRHLMVLERHLQRGEKSAGRRQ